MNPIFQVVVSTLFRLKRTCPKCAESQIVAASKKMEKVRCKRCGADIPPPRR